ANTDISITLVGRIAGTKLLYDLAVVPSKDKITLPNEVFYHPFGGGFTYLKENYLIISRNVEEIKEVPGVGAVRTVSTYKDWVPVTFTGEFERYPTEMTKTAEGVDIRLNQDGYNVRLFKPNAFLGQAMRPGMKIGVASFVVRGMLQSDTTEITRDAYTKTTTKTTTTFPQLPGESWDAFLEEAYQQFEKAFLDTWQVELVSVDQCMKAPSYARLIPSDDKVAVAEIGRGLHGSDALIPTYSYDGIVLPSFTFPSDQPEARIMRELGLDGLIAVTIDCTMEGKGEAARIIPSMAIKVTGAPNGYKWGPTVFAQGLVSASGNSIRAANDHGGTYGERLAFMFEIDKLMNGFSTAFAQLKAEEDKLPYAKIWALKDR
ncbi:MAG: hypothetical protein AAFQ87_26470, partial [Bacteroidota bacterium]